MASFKEVNQARISLKMKLSEYSWYQGSDVLQENDDFYIIIHVSKLNSSIKNIIPTIYNGINVKLNLSI